MPSVTPGNTAFAIRTASGYLLRSQPKSFTPAKAGVVRVEGGWRLMHMHNPYTPTYALAIRCGNSWRAIDWKSGTP